MHVRGGRRSRRRLLSRRLLSTTRARRCGSRCPSPFPRSAPRRRLGVDSPRTTAFVAVATTGGAPREHRGAALATRRALHQAPLRKRVARTSLHCRRSCGCARLPPPQVYALSQRERAPPIHTYLADSHHTSTNLIDSARAPPHTPPAPTQLTSSLPQCTALTALFFGVPKKKDGAYQARLFQFRDFNNKSTHTSFRFVVFCVAVPSCPVCRECSDQ